MKSKMTSVMGAGAALLALVLFIGCSSAPSPLNPALPETESADRQAMWFSNGTQTIFGSEEVPASEVDMATVTWPFEPMDGIHWVIAAGIEDPLEEEFASYPVVRFLGRRVDGTPVIGPRFRVQVSPVIEGRECRLSLS